MKNKIIILSITVLLFVFPGLFSQTTLKIGHVNVAELVNAIPESDSAQILFEKDAKDFNDMLDGMQVELNKLKDDYEKNKDSYSDLVKKTKLTEIADVNDKITLFKQNATQQLQKKQIELLQPIYDKIQAAIKKVATREKFTYVLDISQNSVVFVSDDSQNINPLVLKELGVKQ